MAKADLLRLRSASKTSFVDAMRRGSCVAAEAGVGICRARVKGWPVTRPDGSIEEYRVEMTVTLHPSA